MKEAQQQWQSCAQKTTQHLRSVELNWRKPVVGKEKFQRRKWVDSERVQLVEGGGRQKATCL